MNTKIAGFALVGGLFVCVFGAGQSSQPDHRDGKRLIDPLEGQALYGTYCAVCHGEDGKGAGPMARVLRTAPPDFTQIWMRHGGKFSLERVQKIISGETEVGGHGTREMPLWGPIFAQAAWDENLGRVRIRNLAKYLEKIQAK